ncbi:SOS response-associated peptidase family protein [Anaerorhabdus sp.]|uniref:SOS response-associated peptidase family protein n=2 Tax=Anaerorhabdus sp. TaxID=1872524 RepID=UPI002FC98075
MCGRYLFSDGKNPTLLKIKKYYQEKLSLDVFNQISFEEVFPSQKTVVFLMDNENKLHPSIMKWGLTLNKKQVINLRDENKIAMKYKPCIIIASGYYEWQKNTKEKHFFTTNSGMICLAGCYNDDNEFAIITEEANSELSKIHSRTPFTLSKDDFKDYFKRDIVYSNQYKIIDKTN